MKIIRSKQFQVVILVLSLNVLIFSELFYNSNLYHNKNPAFLMDLSISHNTSNDLLEEISSVSGPRRNLQKWGGLIDQPSQDNGLVNVRKDKLIECIVGKESEYFTPQQTDVFSSYGIETSLNDSLIYIPLTFNGMSIISLLEELTKIPGITYIEPNYYDELMYVPNDTFYANYQYDMRLMGMETAWNYQLGSSSVKVAVLDTGIDYTHPDLSANYLALGYDWVNSDSFPMDDNNHGSHVAGTIAAVINNARGVAGIAQVSIFAEKIIDSFGYGSHADFRSGMMHAVDQGADIISYSGGGSDSVTKREAVEYAVNNGVMVIAAAGNDNVNSPLYPAAYPGVIAVAATDQNDVKASFSNYGSWIDVAAPGVDIASTGTGNSYWLMDGTSMATPHVSGLAALIKSEYPSFSSGEIESTIIDNAIDLGSPGFDVYYGWGRISALNIFETPHKPFSPSPSSGSTGITTNPILSVDVVDPYGDTMDVSFYNASDDSLINVDYNVVSGGRAYTSWSGLSEGTTYSWYAVASDGTETATSPIWSFTTNYPPNTPANPNPSNDIYGVSLNPTLSVAVSDPEGDSLSVSFYDSSDNNLIGTDPNTPSGGIASVSWPSLSESTTYQWYTIVSDGIGSTMSSVWTFTTNHPPDSPLNPTPFDGTSRLPTDSTLSVDVTDFEGDILDVSFYEAPGDVLIGTHSSVVSGTTASVPWINLVDGTTYNWYVVIFDGVTSTTSSSWSFTTNFAPSTIINISPEDETTRITTSPTLRVNVSDLDGDSMNVSFYNDFDNSLIGIDTNVPSGQTASFIWNNLSEGTLYSWYAIVNDGLVSTTSTTWVFTTNYAPDSPSAPLPLNDATNISLNPILSVNISDPDNDIMNVSFYNATDNSLIGIDTGVLSGSKASIYLLELAEGISCSWYVIIDDGLTSTNSSLWTFTTFLDIPLWNQTPTNQIVEYGSFLNYNVNAFDFSGIVRYWVNDSLNFNIDNNGNIISSSYLEVGNYILEIRAYDPFDNNCSAIITITVEDTISPTWNFPLINQTLESGLSFLQAFNASDLSGINRYWVNDTSHFTIDSTGMVTNVTILIPGTYWLEVKAYDPNDNYCSGFIKVIVNLPKESVPVIPPEIPLPLILFLIGSISTLALFLVRSKIKK